MIETITNHSTNLVQKPCKQTLNRYAIDCLKKSPRLLQPQKTHHVLDFDKEA